MGTTVRRLEPNRTRKTQSGLALAGIALLVAFALVGIVAAGTFAAGKLSTSSSSPKSHSGTSGRAVAAQDVARARAQATAIVTAAQSASSNIVKSATKDAQARANGIVTDARKKAQSIIKKANSVAVAQPAPQTQPVAPQVATGPAYTPPATNVYTAPTATPGYTAPQVSTGTQQTTTPNLQGVPASWLVVAYGATFGRGPGGAGGVSVINRGRTPMSGVATVRYSNGGTAQAYFSGLAPGQSAVVPLNGKAYTGGGYSLQVSNVH
jgi:hypothetical protein